MKRNLLLIVWALFYLSAFSQSYLNEDFSGAWMPEGWTAEGVPNQWSRSNSNNAGGQAPEAKFSWVQQNTTSRLISPVMDLTEASDLILSFRHMYDFYSNGPTIGAAFRVGEGEWEVLWQKTPTTSVGPEQIMVEMAGVNQSNVQICLFISGNLYNVNYWYIDDVKVKTPFDVDVALVKVDVSPYIPINSSFQLKGMVVNEGINPITSFDVLYSINEGEAVTYHVSGVNITIGQSYSFTHTEEITLTELGAYTILTTIDNVNGTIDQNPDNNSLESLVSVVSFIPTKKVLAEEATGTWCGWCTRGICFMDYMADTYPDTWIGVAVHNGDPMVYAPYDAAIPNIIPGFMGYPQVTTDRTPGDDDPSLLEAGYERRINTISPATIDIINFHWDPETRMVSFDLESEFVALVQEELRFGVIITEDSLWGTNSQWNQTNFYAGGAFGPMCGFESMPQSILASEMHYDHVARRILDTPFGTEGSLPTPIESGSIHSYSYTIDIPDTWRYEKLSFIGFIVNTVTGEILNANNVISNYLNVPQKQEEIGLSVYPNPAQNEINIAFEMPNDGIVDMYLINMMGKTMIERTIINHGSKKQIIRLNTDELINGTYTLKIQSAGQQHVKKIVINK